MVAGRGRRGRCCPSPGHGLCGLGPSVSTLTPRLMVDQFQRYERAAQAGPVPAGVGRYGVLMALATSMDARADQWRRDHPEYREWGGNDLAFVPTVFDRLDRRLCRLLVYRGWWLTGATIAAYHPTLHRPPDVGAAARVRVGLSVTDDALGCRRRPVCRRAPRLPTRGPRADAHPQLPTRTTILPATSPRSSIRWPSAI
jgi:hypothetical protein